MHDNDLVNLDQLWASTGQNVQLNTDSGILQVNSAGGVTIGGGDLDLLGNNIVSAGDITFNAVTNQVAGIQNQNLLDLSADETVTGAWTFDDNITIGNQKWIGISSTEARLQFNETIDVIQVQGANTFGANTFSVSSNIAMNDSTSIALLGTPGGALNFEMNGDAQDSITVDDSVFVIDDALRGTANWTGQETGAWTNANPSTITVSVSGMEAGDLVLITPITARVGTGDWYVQSGDGSFTVTSEDPGGAFQETMDFNWIWIDQP